MTSTQKWEGFTNTLNLKTNSYDMRGHRRGREQKVNKNGGRHMGKHPSWIFSSVWTDWTEINTRKTFPTAADRIRFQTWLIPYRTIQEE